MNRFKRIVIFSLVLALTVCNGLTASAYESNVSREELHEVAEKTIDHYQKLFSKYEYAGVQDWPSVGLFGFGEDVAGLEWTTEDGKNGLYWREQQILSGNGVRPQVNTDYQRTTIGICAAGGNPTDFGGLDFIGIIKGTQLSNGKFADSAFDNHTGEPVGEDLINAHIFGIIALHCAGEPIPNRDGAYDWLVAQQHPDGGFTYDVKYFEDPEDYYLVDSDVDMTAAGLMALGIMGCDDSDPHVQEALAFLHDVQRDDGGFYSWGAPNPESCSWVIKGLCSIGQDPMGEEWTLENGCNPLTAMLKFHLDDGQFTHVLQKSAGYKVTANGMSTEQALYGMASAYNNKSVYDMIHDKYRTIVEERLFDDYKSGDYAFDETMDLVYDYVLSGYPDKTFKPGNPVTRAEFAKFLVKGLDCGIEDELASDRFSDLNSGHWADECIGVCAQKGWVNGVSDTEYAPNDKITGEQLMAMLVRAVGMEEEAREAMGEGEGWSYGYLIVAEENGLLYPEFEAKEDATRADCVHSLSKLR